ncbi:uncharacterized protein LOC129601056 [Paramacrobiotus metropolitanus]|uniref:uncharacterized protein LOC129601056 n=1 Tax=Paramacrobiotus metropolitanus TaxID=2943436 RepID=UPI002445E250|nr:uncharacterized protein LOC129601056 [Paramacrobiotus metropolitanus]
MRPTYHCDLNLQYVDAEQADILLNHVASLGYSAAALTYDASSEDFTLPKCKIERKARQSEKVRNPIELLPKSLEIKTVDGTPLHIFRRLNVPIEDPRRFFDLAHHALCKTFDILSISTSEERYLQQALDDPHVDIIELNLDMKRPVPVNRKHARQAQVNLKSFEISYGPVLTNPDDRCRFMGNCQRLVNNLQPGDRGKLPEVVMLSSGTERPDVLRKPSDAVCLPELFGIPEKYGVLMNKDTAWQALNNALSRRRTAKGCVQIVSF